jgi:hypothetical protein
MRTVSMRCSSARSGSRRHAADHGDLDEVHVVRGGLWRHVAEGLRGQVCGAQCARLHVLAREVALSLERAQVIIHSVGRADTHARADLAERWGVAAVVNRLADEVEDHLLALREALHRLARLLNGCSIVKKASNRLSTGHQEGVHRWR